MNKEKCLTEYNKLVSKTEFNRITDLQNDENECNIGRLLDNKHKTNRYKLI